MQLLITTQYRENYGAHDWDGEGACPQYWKNKGGNYYLITGVETTDNLQELVTKASGPAHLNCSYASDYSTEEIITWEVFGDNENLGLEDYELAGLRPMDAASIK